MPTYTQTAANTAFVLTEAAGHRSRENIVIASGSGILAPGTVLAKLTSGAEIGKFTPARATGADGSQTAAAVLLYRVDATTSDVRIAGVARDCEVNGKGLVYHPSIATAQDRLRADAQLAAAGILVR